MNIIEWILYLRIRNCEFKLTALNSAKHTFPSEVHLGVFFRIFILVEWVVFLLPYVPTKSKSYPLYIEVDSFRSLLEKKVVAPGFKSDTIDMFVRRWQLQISESSILWWFSLGYWASRLAEYAVLVGRWAKPNGRRHHFKWRKDWRF